jgi:hypothetical protein
MDSDMASLPAHVTVRGEFDLVHIRDGVIISNATIKNLVLNVGKEFVAKLINGLHVAPFTHIQIGNGDNAAAVTDTHLYTFYTEAIGAASYAEGYKAVLSYTFQFNESTTICEAGLCDGVQAASPHMLSRQVFAGRDVIKDDLLQVTWRITVG